MQTPDFEAHITIARNEYKVFTIMEIGKVWGFHFSQMFGWDEGGQGWKYFLTKQGKDFAELLSDMEMTCIDLDIEKIDYSRIKIEIAVYDKKFK